MANSRELAKLIGPTLMAITLSEAINLHIWAKNIAPVTFLNGALLFVAGLSILRVHHAWTPEWSVLITLVGWLSIFAGLYRMFAPEAPQGAENLATYAVISILFAIGAVLTFEGYRRTA